MYRPTLVVAPPSHSYSSKMLVLLSCSLLALASASPFWDNLIQTEDDSEAVDEGLTAQLMEIGESLFGSPKKESGNERTTSHPLTTCWLNQTLCIQPGMIQYLSYRISKRNGGWSPWVRIKNNSSRRCIFPDCYETVMKN